MRPLAMEREFDCLDRRRAACRTSVFRAIVCRMPEPDDAKPLAFILMPFDSEYDDVYTDLIVVPLTTVGFRVRRADSLLNQRNILQEVVVGIADADLIVADVTGLNPNVMYELGLAHALGKRTIMITQSIEQLPFDLRTYKGNEYSVNFKEAGKLVALLESIGSAVLAGEADFSNPVQDFAPTALPGTAQVQTGPRPRASNTSGSDDAEDDDGGDRDDEDEGLLEGLARLQDAGARTQSVTEAIGAETVAIGEKFTAGGAKLDRIRKNLGPDRGLQPSLVAMREIAKDLDAYADTISPLNGDLREALKDVVLGANVVARRRVINDDDDLQTIKGELESLDTLSTTLVESYFSISGFSSTIAALPAMESHLTRASRHAAKVVAETAEILETAQADIDRVRALFKARADGSA